MGFILEVRLPTEKANELIKAGKFEQMLQSIMSDVKPEAAYLSEMDGARGGYFVVNLDDASQIPAVAEPFFFAGATVKIHPVMLPEDLAKGSAALQQAAQKYG
ncbi:MAG: DUF3303 family protein [Chloroflexota bacterium]|nr:MAG: hypothetical protein DLM70_17305 [Chloroflexota bacterium]